LHIKFLIRLAIFLVAVLLCALIITNQTVAAPTVDDNLINPPYGPTKPPAAEIPLPAKPQPVSQQTGWHTTRAERNITSDKLAAFLEKEGSPLAVHAAQILESPHYSTIIGISAIEQRFCTIRPRVSPYNCWGIMQRGGGLAKYQSFEESIQAISDLLVRYEARGKDTLEELNGYYVVPASANWFSTVLKIKLQVENL
jgi:hypothetical protein